MAGETITELERVRYWQGQLLASADLQTQLRVDEELRRLHNRAVHQAYGVAIGLGIADDDAAKLEDGKLKLPCGMAYDCAGRGLIVEEERTIPLPVPVTDNLTLVLAYDPASVDGIALRWMPAPDVNANTGVALTRLILKDGNAKIDAEFRPVVVRPMARPRMAIGTTIPGETAWKPWKIGSEEIGVQVEVDTSSEGFTRLPHYFAEVIAGKPTEDFVPAWFASIAEPSAHSFTLRLMLRRITRESLDIADPKVQVSATPTVDNLSVNLEKRDLLFKRDRITRLLPLARQASLITVLGNSTATLDFPLQDFTEAKQVAFGNPPRVDVVEPVTDTGTFEVTVDPPDIFEEGQVVLKLGGALDTTHPAKIISIDDTETMELSPRITDLHPGDTLGILESGSMVDGVEGERVEVADTSKFAADGLVVWVKEPVESSALAKIKEIDEENKTLVLFEAIKGLTGGKFLSVAKPGGKVKTATDLPKEVKVKVANNIRQFKANDIVAKRFADGSFSPPVRVKGVKLGQKILDLSAPIAGLEAGDTIAAADFRVRATVLAKSVTVAPPIVTTLTVADSKVFSTPAFIAKIDHLLNVSLLVPIKSIPADDKLELDGRIEGLEAGDVIGLCAFPATVEVIDIQDDGSIVVSNGALLHKSDVVTARTALNPHTALSIVAGIKGNVVRLAEAIPDLAAGDQLSVATIRGVMDVTPAPLSTPSNPKVKVVQKRLRQGDFLANITGWFQPRQGNSSVASISEVTSEGSGDQIGLSHRLDGLLENDTIGLASLLPTLWLIRLNQMLTNLRPGDEVLVVGQDRLQGNTRSMFATVSDINSKTKQLTLFPNLSKEDFTFRPEDVSASVLFVRGSALALIQKQDLFVSWLAVGVSDPMPKPCAGVAVPDCGCTAKE
jgi:hypothetical protein